MEHQELIQQADRNCPILKAAGVVGDKWVLLILRELYLGTRRFDTFQKHLQISKSVLANKLNYMIDEELIHKKPYQEPGERARFSYHFTLKGAELSKVIIALLEWGNRHMVEGDAPTYQIIRAVDQAPLHLSLRDEDERLVPYRDAALAIEHKGRILPPDSRLRDRPIPPHLRPQD